MERITNGYACVGLCPPPGIPLIRGKNFMKMTIISGKSRRSGYALVTVLVFLTVLSTLVAGLGVYTTSHNQRATVDLAYAHALDAAEAGINAEYQKISTDSTTADQYPGVTYNVANSAANGTYKVYCIGRDGSFPWTTSQYLYVISPGNVTGVSRTVKAEGKGFPPAGHYAIYTLDSLSVWKGASALITGDVGSNGQYQYTADPTINGGVYFNGPGAGWSNGDPGVYTVAYSPKPVVYPTVEEIANKAFPLGGLI